MKVCKQIECLILLVWITYKSRFIIILDFTFEFFFLIIGSYIAIFETFNIKSNILNVINFRTISYSCMYLKIIRISFLLNK